MKQIWFILNTLTVGSAFAAITLLIMLVKKFKDPFFKYNLFIISVLNFIGIFYALIINLYETDQQAELFSIWSIGIHLFTIPGTYLWIGWSSKMVGQKRPFPLFVFSVAGSIILSVNFILQLIFGSVNNLILPMIFAGFAITYSFYTILRNIDKITLLPAQKYFKFFTALMGLTVTFGWIIALCREVLMENNVFYIALNINSLVNSALNIFVLFFIGKYFFHTPAEEESTTLPIEFTNRFSLSNREQELLQLIIEGYTAKEIGEKMYISTQTAKNYRYRLYQKLDVRNKIDLINLVNNNCIKHLT